MKDLKSKNNINYNKMKKGLIGNRLFDGLFDNKNARVNLNQFSYLLIGLLTILLLAVVVYGIEDSINPAITFGTGTPNSGDNTNSLIINLTTSDDNAEHYSLVDFDNSLVGWWRFNNETGENETFVKDFSSYGNNGTVNGGATGINYVVQTFTSNGTFVVPAGVTNVEVLIVAGGGGAGAYFGGGGGAGGLIYNSSYGVSAGSYNVTVGSGGAGAPAGAVATKGTNGGNSSFGDLIAIGGGGGSYAYGPAGNAGGSGGGGALTTAGGLGVAGQGNVGGTANSNGGVYGGGGGGGAGTAGVNGSTSSGGHGGNGTNYTISGSNVYYAGGGGGSAWSNPVGKGGLGGGGNASASAAGGDGTANTGSGGGGGGLTTAFLKSGDGGSGVVIVRYLDSGKWGRAMTFDGTSGYVNVGDKADIGTGNFAVSFWMKSTSSVFQNLISKSHSGGATGRWDIGSIDGDGTKIDFWIEFPSVTFKTTSYSGNAYDGTWKHIVGTVNRTGNMQLYVNGVAVGTPVDVSAYSADNLDTSDPLNIAGYGNERGWFNGSIDDVLIFNRSLSTAEIQSLYNSTANKYINTFTSIGDGSHSFKGHVVDGSGNVNSTETRTVTLDATAPSLVISSPLTMGYSSSSVLFNLTSSETSSGNGFIVPNLDGSLVSWWRMDDLNSSGGLVDYLGVNNGTAVGGAVQNSAGKFGKSMTFDGVDDSVDLGNTPTLNYTGSTNLTISAWIKTNSTSGGAIYSKRYSSWGGLQIDMSSSGILVFYGNDTVSPASGNWDGNIMDDNWHQIVVTIVPSNFADVHIDGVDLGNQDISSVTGSVGSETHATIGSGVARGNFNGSIDEVAIFNKSLTSDEIMALYNATRINHQETLAEGSHNYKVYAGDTAGNVATSDVNLTVDTISPSVTIVSPVNMLYNSSINVNVSLNENGSVQFSVDSGVTNYTMSSANNQNFNYSYSIATGSYTLNVYANDSAGNRNDSLSIAFSADANAPALDFQGQTLSNNSYTNINSTEINISSSDANSHYTFVDSDNSLMLWYRMDDVNGSLGVTDLSSYSNNGSSYSDILQNSSGKFGKAMQFNGSNTDASAHAYILANNVISPSKLTACAWIKIGNTNTANSNNVIISKYMSTGTKRTFGLWQTITTNTVAFTTSPSGSYVAGNTLVTSSSLYDGLWHQVCGIHNGTYNFLYVDGTLNASASATSGLYASDEVIAISCTRVSGACQGYDHFNGLIDEVMIFNRSLSAGEVQSLYNSTAYQYYNNFTNLAQGQHSYKGYSVDEVGNLNSTSTRILTVDTTNPNGTILNYANNSFFANGTGLNFTVNLTDNLGLKNATLNVNRTDISNSWLEFDGVNDYVNTSGVLNYSVFSASVWFRTNSLKNGANIINNGYHTGSVNDSWQIRLGVSNPSTLIFAVGNGTANAGVGTTTFPIVSDIWEHAVVVYNSSSGVGSVYYNGVFNYSGTFKGMESSSVSLKIGADSSYTNNFNGSIDEVRIYNRSLTADEISQIYKNTLKSNVTIVNSTGLVAYYDFNEGTGSTLIDRATGINNGTISGASWSNTEQTTVNFAEGTVSTVIGVVKNLLEGVYKWWWSVYDYAGLLVQTDNSTLTVDLTKPVVQFISPTLTNNSGIAGNTYINVSIFDLNFANVTYYWNGTYITFNNTNENVTNLGGGNWVFTYVQDVVAGSGFYLYNVSAMDYAGNENSTETRTTNGNVPPSFSQITTTPDILDYDGLDPWINVTVNVNVTDITNNFEFAMIQWKNSTGIYGENNITLTNITAMITSGLFNATLTLPSYEANVTFRIWANDSAGAIGISSNYSLWSYWDCTWNATSDLGATAGYNTNKNIGYLIINNTGDVQHANSSCTLQFRVSYDLSEGRVYYDSEYVKNLGSYTVSAKSIQNITINATFASEIKQENLIITTDEFRGRSDTRYRNTSAIIVTNQNGPYLYEKITASPVSVYITSEEFNLNGYFRNLMGSTTVNENNTAYNVSFYWALPSGLTNASGNINVSYENISDNNLNYLNANITFSSTDAIKAFSPGVKEITLKAYGYNLSGDLIRDANNNTLLTESVNVTFLCYGVKDDKYVTACGSLDGDYVAPTTTVTTPGTGGGGGGFASGGGGGESRADYQFVRGKTNEIIIPFVNKDKNNSLRGIKFSLSGELSKYMELVTSSVSELGPGQSTDIIIRVTSPGFIKLGQQVIGLEISGSTPLGNYYERKSIVLQVNDISKEDAFALIGNATALVEQFTNAGFNYSEVERLALDMKDKYNKLDYLSVKNDYNSLSEIVESAIESKKIISELNDLIAQSREKGIDVSGSERILRLAELSLNRNDYAEAYARAKEAQVTFALEVKGEIAKLSYYLKNNKKEIGMSAFFLFVLGFAGYKGTSIRLLVMRIKRLKEEEKILHGLMKILQRQTFTEKKMSMEEYGQSMQFYEKRLGNVVEELIELESKRAHALRFTTEEGRMKVERDRIVSLIKEIQTEYLKEKSIETKSYELRLESYNRRLGMIDESLATIEAKEALKGVLR